MGPAIVAITSTTQDNTLSQGDATVSPLTQFTVFLGEVESKQSFFANPAQGDCLPTALALQEELTRMLGQPLSSSLAVQVRVVAAAPAAIDQGCTVPAKNTRRVSLCSCCNDCVCMRVCLC